VQGNGEGEGVRVFSKRTAASIAEMMNAVVDDEHGTGGKAAISGVIIGGKTGTAQKAREDGRGYAEGKYIAGFAGFADATPIGLNQKLALMVAVDEPSSAIYGGVVAAPIFRRIMQRVLHHLSTEQHLNGEADESVVPVSAELTSPVSPRFPGRAVFNALVRQDRG
jgi:cell division protein FtsI/penicillin-binding protein 2